ncbi:M90 family metallopeptidase [Flavobacterium sp. ST-75]|uniref:M90 family metallopeptidase n=1 Tax=Flavobacterium rhizophilum TaxID=3163296 RepID=A0ABW8Y7N5_9FLAO
MNYIISVAVIIIVALFFILKKPKKAVAKPFPSHWHQLLLDNVLFYRNLTPERQTEFQKRIMQFLSEVYIEGVQFEVTDLDKILVACSAVIPVFGFTEWHYYNLSGVLLYPDYFNEDLDFADTAKSRNIGGLVGTGRFENQMILSRKALYHGFFNTTDKGNTGIHEFVHLIDKMDGLVDGVPEKLLGHQYAIPWLDLIHKKMEAINDDKSDIREYGGTNQAEFFAVASEYFFERPDLLKRKHPELYKMMEMCFNTNKQ